MAATYSPEQKLRYDRVRDEAHKLVDKALATVWDTIAGDHADTVSENAVLAVLRRQIATLEEAITEREEQIWIGK